MTAHDHRSRALLARLRSDSDRICREIIETIADEEPAYSRFPSDDEAAVWRHGIRQLLALWLSLAEEGRRVLRPDERDGILSIGATRADQGFDSLAVRASVRAAVTVVRRYLRDECESGPGLAKEETWSLVEELHSFGNQVEDLLQEGLDARHKERVRNREKELARLIRDIEEGALADTEAFSKRLGVIGCDTSVSRALVVVPDTVEGDDAVVAIRTQLPGSAVVNRTDGTVHPHSVVVVPVPLNGSWPSIKTVVANAARAAQTTALVVGPTHDVDDYCDSYTAATALLPFVATVAGRQPLLEAEDLVAYTLVAAVPPQMRRWLRRQIGKAVERRPKEFDFLGWSIDDDFTLSSVERRTGVNIKTLRLRKAALQQSTERDYDNSADRLALTAAYCASRLDGAR